MGYKFESVTPAGISDLDDFTTDDLDEGDINLYYTDDRADDRVDAGFAAKSTTDLDEGDNLYFTDARAIAAPLTGFSSTTGTVGGSDSILDAIEKLVGNLALHPTMKTGMKTGGDQSNTSSTPVVATGLTFAVGASESWGFEFDIFVASNNTNGTAVGLNCPTGTTGRIAGMGLGSSSTNFRSFTSTAVTGNVVSGSFAAINQINGGVWCRIMGSFTTDSTAGNAEFIFAPVVNTEEAKIRTFSTFRAWKI